MGLFDRSTLKTDVVRFNPSGNISKNNSNEIFQNTLEFFTNDTQKAVKLNNSQRNLVSKQEILKDVEDYLEAKNIDKDIINEVVDQFEKYIWGYYLLNDLIEDESISDIKVLSKDNTRIKQYGERKDGNIHFPSNEILKSFINRIATKNQISLSDINAIQTFTDKTTSSKFILRINISTEYVNSVDNPYLHIRKIPKQKYTREQLISYGLATEEQLDFLIDRIKNGNGIIFTGKGASGKTTLMNFLIDEIPHNCSGLVIQENEELFSKTHPDIMFQRVRYAKGEGRIEYTLKDEAINGLLIDLDYFIIGEIKGGEALYFLNASYTGHKCIASVHGVNSTEALNKLAEYVKYESDYSKSDILKMLKHLDVCYMEKFKVKEYSEVKGFDEKRQELIYNTIYKGEEKINESCR